MMMKYGGFDRHLHLQHCDWQCLLGRGKYTLVAYSFARKLTRLILDTSYRHYKLNPISWTPFSAINQILYFFMSSSMTEKLISLGCWLKTFEDAVLFFGKHWLTFLFSDTDVILNHLIVYIFLPTNATSSRGDFMFRMNYTPWDFRRHCLKPQG